MRHLSSHEKAPLYRRRRLNWPLAWRFWLTRRSSRGCCSEAELTGIALPVARVLGIALMALGVACLPGCTAFGGMLTYSVLATGYLAWLAFGGEWVGPLLWPAVVAHAILTLLLARAWLTIRSAATAQQHP